MLGCAILGCNGGDIFGWLVAVLGGAILGCTGGDICGWFKHFLASSS